MDGFVGDATKNKMSCKAPASAYMVSGYDHVAGSPGFVFKIDLETLLANDTKPLPPSPSNFAPIFLHPSFEHTVIIYLAPYCAERLSPSTSMAPRAKTASTKKLMSQPRTGRRNSIPIEEPSRKSLRLQKKPPASQAVQSRPVQSSITEHRQPRTSRRDIVNKPLRKSLRLQNKPSAPYAARSRPVQSATQTKRRRLQATKKTKDRNPAERQGRCTPRLKPSGENLRDGSEADVNANQPEGVHPPESVQPPEKPQEPLQLSEKNLRAFNQEMMAGKRKAQSTKPTQPPCSLALSRLEIDTAQTQTSSHINNRTYRQKNLKSFEIVLHAKPPSNITAATDRIINAEVPKNRLDELSLIARQFHEECFRRVEAMSGEDDFIDPVKMALYSLGLSIHNKPEWRKELMPVVQRHFSARPKKRQRLSAGEYVSSESPQTNATTSLPGDNPQKSSMMPPSARPSLGEKHLYLKNTRPDLLIGITYESLISALSLQNLSDGRAEDFVQWLETYEVPRGPEGQYEPALIFLPSDQVSTLTFPFAVVEGKAYSTGRQIFEAENQAAVSGACGLKIQLDLDSLANSGTASSTSSSTSSGTPRTSSNTKPPLFFSITTQGPIHELWCHWAFVRASGVRSFKSKLLDSYNVLLLERAKEFIVKVNNLANWSTGAFMESIVERLRKVAADTEDSWLLRPEM